MKTIPPYLYQKLQQFVHRGHSSVFEVFERLLQPEPGATVLELGCGTGALAEPFLASGYDYVGVDINPQRIAQATHNFPHGSFIVSDLVNFDISYVPKFQYCILHGLLHHLSDEGCRELFKVVLSSGSDRRMAISEPVRPDRWWENPGRALLSSLDQGDYVRKLDAWLQLLDSHLINYSTRSLMPRWPMVKIEGVLGPREAIRGL